MNINQIAAGMRAEANGNGNGIARFTLLDGLRLTLQKSRRIYTLSLTRYGSHASDAERKIYPEAFGCPEICKTDSERYQIEYIRGYGVTRFVWEEPAQGQLMEVESEQGMNQYQGDMGYGV